MAFDLMLRGGLVVDGTGAPARSADVAIERDRVVAVGVLDGAEAEEVLDVTGLIVAPGFIDTHAHTDMTPLLPADAAEIRLASLRQGVTTEVCGNCGLSPYPLDASGRSNAEVFGSGSRPLPTFSEWADKVESGGMPVNLVSLVGHGALRERAMGLGGRAPTTDELDDMCRYLDEALEAGAAGLSTGLIYPPGVYSETEEIVALAKVAAARGRIYTSHMRDEADRVHVALAELIQIAREAALPAHVSHHKVARRRNWGRCHETLGIIDRAREEGLDVTLDVYPYTAGSTVLHGLLPPWANDGGFDALLERLEQPEERRRIDRDQRVGLEGWQDLVGTEGWDGVVIAATPRQPELEGKSIHAIAKERESNPIDVVAEILLTEQRPALIVIHNMDERDMNTILQHPASMIGSDGVPVPGKPHPRLTGTFVRILGRYVREQKLLGLEEAVRKMTGLSADRFALRDRGVIRDASIADLVVFDPDNVAERGTFEEPMQRPEGVRHVIVAGMLAVREGEVTGVEAGRVLRTG